MAVGGGVALLSRSELLVAGMPIVYFWVLLWFILTSVCLAASWHFFDRKDCGDEEANEERRTEREGSLSSELSSYSR